MIWFHGWGREIELNWIELNLDGKDICYEIGMVGQANKEDNESSVQISKFIAEN